MTGTLDAPTLDTAYGWDNNVMWQSFENGSKYSTSRPKWIVLIHLLDNWGFLINGLYAITQQMIAIDNLGMFKKIST